MWRLGVPAGLMVAFALIGLAQAPWRGDDAPPTVPAVVPVHGTPGGRTDTAVTSAAAEPVEDTDAEAAPRLLEDAGQAPAQPDLVTSDAESTPSTRLPEELEPVAPDVVVAMGLARPGAGRIPVTMHSHTDSAHDGPPAARLDGAMAPAGDDIQAPEPGARFWFGPDGLERVRILGEAQP